MIAIQIYVIDTSYFLELYRVDGDSSEEAHLSVKRKFSEKIENSAQFFVPVAVLFELANHIADIKDSTRRKALAEQLRRDIDSSIKEQTPWTITHSSGAESIHELLAALNESASRFAYEFAAQKLGLTDTTVILEAERLRKKHVSDTLRNYQIHIWTRHNELKAREPDVEESPFV